MRKLIVAALLFLAACSQSSEPPKVDTSVIGAGDNWDNPGGDWAGSHFSRLTDITPANVGELGLAWEYDLGTARVQEATPVVIDGVMYTSGNLGRVYALNAATGEQLWKFEPEVDMQVNRWTCCDQANRGVQVHDGKVFVGSLDGYLYALDAKTGDVAWKTDTIADRKRGYTVTGAPEIAGDLVIIGNAGAENDTRGYVTAYNAKDGIEAWRFWTIPRDPKDGPQESEALEAALKTWDPKSRWDIGGGGTVWDAIQYDPQFDQVIIGVGNGGPYPLHTRSPKGGDNLYLNSLVALDRETGEMKWHFQETPTDSWDLTATQPMVFSEMEVGGKKRPVILHTPKNGFFFVVDRESGKPLAANALVRTSWASGWDLESGKPVLTPEYSDYSTGPKIVFPASSGARNWHPAAYDPTRNLYFAAVVDMGNLMFIPPGQENPARRERFLNPSAALIFTADLQAAAATLPPPMQAQIEALPQWKQVLDLPYSSQIRAIDPLTGKTKWAADFDGWQDRGGVLATESGLVIHGTLAGKLIVRDAETGKILKSIETGSSMLAAPMTYRVNGVQYVAVQTGWGGGGWGFVPPYAAAYGKGNANRLLVFKIGGKETRVPADLPPIQPAPEAPAQLPGVTPAMLAMGSGLFTENCSICHSNQPRAPLPDLRRLDKARHEAFNQIVLEGLFTPNGMPHFEDLLKPDQVKAIHAFLIDEQTKLRARELQLKAQGKPLDSRSLTILSNF
ncbi:PQQ-dependent dehydrogenase, methanol/ethanol family [Croceibacterium sp. LX-88]|uniref:PQQ-dependent dehydrogenase, methanol/ethanol family n=1 Tax=Croceibacterium selenioxidans TaxID=2838833 RepID=A0ABS5W728_9SPHN|nr:PQQ-dependent dehydrogenase, methanol/ethanol family [Croceibacterium selenioxidans]MBT2135563.1 PQQ-dependent dehydrogenase, methanol/ethanol family [Croceibacterium selenioxidans]